MSKRKPVQPEVGKEYEVSCGLGVLQVHVTDIIGYRVYARLTKAHSGYLTKKGDRYGAMPVGFCVSMNPANAAFYAPE